jgi:hypothetical protein
MATQAELTEMLAKGPTFKYEGPVDPLDVSPTSSRPKWAGSR